MVYLQTLELAAVESVCMCLFGRKGLEVGERGGVKKSRMQEEPHSRVIRCDGAFCSTQNTQGKNEGLFLKLNDSIMFWNAIKNYGICDSYFSLLGDSSVGGMMHYCETVPDSFMKSANRPTGGCKS